MSCRRVRSDVGWRLRGASSTRGSSCAALRCAPRAGGMRWRVPFQKGYQLARSGGFLPAISLASRHHAARSALAGVYDAGRTAGCDWQC